jgi:putative ATP-dependent endonuclease of OLD family
MEGKKTVADVEAAANTEFEQLMKSAGDDRAVLCSQIYKLFHSGDASKAIASQYLANTLTAEREKDDFDPAAFAGKLPPYVVAAISHATGAEVPAVPADDGSPVEDTDG